MKNFFRNLLKRRALSFSQSKGFQDHLKVIFNECCEDDAGVNNSEMYTVVLSLYLYVAQHTNVISGRPPSKKDVQNFVLVADKNFDGVVSFDECEVVALLLCEHCAFQISAYWLVTYFITPFIAMSCFLGVYLAAELEYFHLNALFEFTRTALPQWVHYVLDEKLLFLFFVSLLNYCLVPTFSKIWVYFLYDSLKPNSGTDRLPGGSATPLDIPPTLDPPPLSLDKNGKRKASIYDVYDSDTTNSAPHSRCSTPTPVDSSHHSASGTGSSPASPSYPISYAQFQFVSGKDEAKMSPPGSGTRLKNRRRSSAPPDELRRSLPTSSTSPDKSKTPTVFKKLRSTFKK